MNITVCEYPNGYAGDFFCSTVSLCCKDYYKISELCWNSNVHLGIYYPINTKENYTDEFEYQYLPDKIYKDIDLSNQQNLILSSHGLVNEFQYDKWYNIDNRVNKIINLQLFSESTINNYSLFPIWNVAQRNLKSIDPSKIYNYIYRNINEINIKSKDYHMHFKKMPNNHTIFVNIIPALVDNDFSRFKDIFIKLFEQIDLIELKKIFQEYQSIKMKPYFNFLKYLQINNTTLKIYTPNENYSYVIS